MRADYWFSIVASLVVILATVWTSSPEKFGRGGQDTAEPTPLVSDSSLSAVRLNPSPPKPVEPMVIERKTARVAPGRTNLPGKTDYANWQALWAIQAHPGGFEGAICQSDCIHFSPDRRSLLSGSSDKTLKLWDVASGGEIRTFDGGFFGGHSHAVQSVAFSPDGSMALSGSRRDHENMLWNRGTPKLWGNH